MLKRLPVYDKVELVEQYFFFFFYIFVLKF